MKTLEFINQLNALEFEVERETTMGSGAFTRLLIQHPATESTVAIVYLNEYCSLSTSFCAFDNLEDTLKRKFFTILTDYVLTPVSEREDSEKMYHVVIGRDVICGNGVSRPYCVLTNQGHIVFDICLDSPNYLFTQEQVDALLDKWKPFAEEVQA